MFVEIEEKCLFNFLRKTLKISTHWTLWWQISSWKQENDRNFSNIKSNFFFCYEIEN